MASSTHLYIILFLIGVCSIFLDSLFAEGNSQFSDSIAIEGQGSSFFFYQKSEYPRDCSDVRDACSSSVSSGVYLIKPDGYEEPFEAYCDHDIDSGGWTTVLSRFDGSVDFNRNWNEYKSGFGFLSTEFWLGNDKLSFLTNQAVYELRIDITMENGTTCDVKYTSFRISDEWSDYKLSTVGAYVGDLGEIDQHCKLNVDSSACRWKECNTPEECNPDGERTTFTDCNDVYNAGNTQDGVYLIRPQEWNESPFEAFCNMSIDGGNWTVIQRRVDGSTNFYRNWTEYREGFGDVQHEFWLGNEKLHHITKQATYEYRVDYVYSSSSYYNKYTNFHVDNETNKYRLANVGSRTGTRGYSIHYINNTPFSTYDEDNDGKSYNCAEGHRSGWWHGAYFYTYSSSYCYYFQSGSTHVRCSYANLNGDFNGGNGQNIYDHNYYSCNQKYTEMKIRRIS